MMEYTPTDLDVDLERMHADLRELADLAERVRQHPRYHALTREVDTPDHPAARLAAWLDVQSYTEAKRALRDCLDWMDGGTTE